jgi:hypothetical protein
MPPPPLTVSLPQLSQKVSSALLPVMRSSWPESATERTLTSLSVVPQPSLATPVARFTSIAAGESQ